VSYKLIVFDWDGTLYDSSAFIVRCVQSAAREEGMQEPTPEAIRNLVGLNSDEAIRRNYPNASPMQVANLIKTYRKQALMGDKNEAMLFEGVHDVIAQLHASGLLLAVATGKGRAGLETDLHVSHLAPYFSTVRCGDESFSKPHPQMLLEILDELDIAPSEALMIGDTEYDMQMACNAGTDALAVSYGMHDLTQANDSHIKGCIHDIRELPGFLG
jgi:phosphoglycolate phosphatase